MPWPMTVWTTEVEARVLAVTGDLPSQPEGEGGGIRNLVTSYGQFQLLVYIIYILIYIFLYSYILIFIFFNFFQMC